MKNSDDIDMANCDSKAQFNPKDSPANNWGIANFAMRSNTIARALVAGIGYLCSN